jgi:hypothetical protein
MCGEQALYELFYTNTIKTTHQQGAVGNQEKPSDQQEQMNIVNTVRRS